MNIGDRVRLMHSNEEGIISKINNSDIVSVEIEDGFDIDVLKNELVVIASEEKKHFEEEELSVGQQDKKKSIKKTTEIISNKGIYFGFVDHGNDMLSLYLINNTDYQIVYSVANSIYGSFEGVAAGVLYERSNIKIAELNIKKFEKWAPLLTRLMFHKNGIFSENKVIEKKIKFNAKSFFKHKGEIPQLEKPGYSLQIDQNFTKINTEELKTTLVENQVIEKEIVLEKPQEEVDLHIESLRKDWNKMEADEIFRFQLDEYDKKIDSAQATGMEEIIFIHGTGNRKLRDEIHKRLSKTDGIAYYEDAKKDKFGYGATKICFKYS